MNTRTTVVTQFCLNNNQALYVKMCMCLTFKYLACACTKFQDVNPRSKLPGEKTDTHKHIQIHIQDQMNRKSGGDGISRQYGIIRMGKRDAFLSTQNIFMILVLTIPT